MSRSLRRGPTAPKLRPAAPAPLMATGIVTPGKAARGKNDVAGSLAVQGFISRFMDATASSSPVNRARQMMAWPILSSRTPSIAAIACTLW